LLALPVLPAHVVLQVPQLYKRLKYPFQISKSNLTAVGSPHTWPSLLAALTWLVELLNYQERAEAARQVGEGGGVGGWVLRKVGAWLAGWLAGCSPWLISYQHQAEAPATCCHPPLPACLLSAGRG
jgi:hypothetical protein